MNRRLATVRVKEARRMDGLWEDLLKIGEETATNTVNDTISSGGSKAVDTILKSSDFKKITDIIEQKARDGVKEEASKNAVKLLAFAVAGGAIGGVIFRGTIGIVGAGLIAAWAGSSLIAPPPAKK